MLDDQPNFKGNMGREGEYDGCSPRRARQRSPSPGLADRKKKRRERENQPTMDDEFRERVDNIEKSYCQMDAVLSSLMEKSVVPKLRSEQVDTLTEMIISVQDHSKRMEESLNRAVAGLKNFELELAAKLNNQGSQPFANGMKGSPQAPGGWQEARLQLQSLEERLASLQAAIK